jgi:predicted dehydrogenase
MLRIGIVGTDSTHALSFAKVANLDDLETHVPGCRVTAICGDDPKRTAEIAAEARIEAVFDNPSELLKKIDAVMIVYRKGGRHLTAARPFLEAGIPTFIDKPLASSVADAEEILCLAEKHNAPLTSYSALPCIAEVRSFIETHSQPAVSGDRTVPAADRWVIVGGGDFHGEYDGIFFYGPHHVELMLAGCGTAPKTVVAADGGDSGSFTVTFENGRMGTAVFQKNLWRFFMHAYADQKEFSLPLDMKTAYRDGLAVFKNMAETGRPPFSRERLLTVVRILAAAHKSFETGTVVNL